MTGGLLTAFAASGSPPPPPPQGTPRALRVVLRLLGLPWAWTLQLYGLVRRTLWAGPWRLEGACQRSGGCCRYLLLSWPVAWARFDRLRRLYRWWHTEVHGLYPLPFALVGDAQGEAEVFACRHLREDRSCAEHWLRPVVCRSWPAALGEEPPVLRKGCGFRVVGRGLPILPE